MEKICNIDLFLEKVSTAIFYFCRQKPPLLLNGAETAAGLGCLFLRILHQIIECSVRAEVARSGKLHAEVQVFFAFGPGIRVQNHRYAQTVCLGKDRL